MSVKPCPQPVLRVPPRAEAAYTGDRQLIAAILTGDGRAAGEFYNRLRPVIDHALRRVLRGGWGDIEDLVQVTFERVIRGLAEDRFQGRSSLTTWASGVAGHVALDALRRKVRDDRRLALVTADSYTRAESCLEARSELQRLHEILSRMKPMLANTLVLHDVLGHDLGEVAQLTDATLSATQSRLFRARKELLRRAGAKVAARGAR